MVIRDYLLSTQKKLCHNANRFIPAALNTGKKIDIVQMFTDLELLKENEMKQVVKPTTLEEILDIIKSTPACKVLVEGEGGIGKSTILRYIAYNWATESDETFKGKIVFLVKISSIAQGKTILDGIVKQIDLKEFQFETNLSQDPKLIEQFIRNHNDEVVLLLDGLDELKDGSESLVSYFYGRNMNSSKVILTSRSEKLDEFIETSDIHVKIQGFNTYNIQKYIKKHFEFFKESALGDSLIRELQPDKYSLKHPEINSMCKNPMFLLLVCTMWEEKQQIPDNSSDLFLDFYRCILNQYIEKQETNKKKISKYEDIPERFINAMVLLGKCMYKSLKGNIFSINLRHLDLEGKEEIFDLALKLGFVYKEAPISEFDLRVLYTAPNKLIVDSFVGFYLYKLCQPSGYESKGSEDMKMLLQPLDDNEWMIIRSSEHFDMARKFAIGFLGADAGMFLSHWITNNVSTYHSLMPNFRVVNEEYRVIVEKAVIDHMINTDLEIKPHINDICKSLRKFIRYIIPDVEVNENEHFMQLMRRIDNLQIPYSDIEYFCKKVFSEGNVRILTHILLTLADQKWILQKISRIFVNDDFNCLTAEYEKLHFKYDITQFTLDSSCSASYLVHLLSNAPQLNRFLCSPNCVTGAIMSNVIRECSSKGVRLLELEELMISNNKLSNIDGSLLAIFLAKIAPTLNKLKMSNCSLSSLILNDTVRYCFSNRIDLQFVHLDISGNNLSNINGSSLMSLFAITPKLDILILSNCSLSDDAMNYVIRECESQGVMLQLQHLDISDNNLSSINGSLVASLLVITPELINLDMSNCSLSGTIINDMIRSCSSKGINFKLKRLFIEGNNLSEIEIFSFVSLFITIKLNTLVMDNCSLSGAFINDVIKECSSIGVNLDLDWLQISENNLGDINGFSFAFLIITTKLNTLCMSNCNLSGAIMNNMIRECSSRGVKLEIRNLDFSNNSLSDIDGASFASLFITPKLNKLDMSNCSLSGAIMNDMIRECFSRGVKLYLDWLNISENNLGDIDGASFASLFITPKLNKLVMDDCNLSGAIINDMTRECSSRRVKLELMEIYFSRNNLSNVDGASFVSLFITPKLNTIFMNNCSLSGVIMNDMIIECYSIGVNLEFKKLDFSGNNLSDVDGASFAFLFFTPTKLSKLSMSNCSLSGAIMNDMIRECSSRGVKLELKEIYFSKNNLSDVDGSSFASLFITTKLNALVMNNCSLSGANMNDMIRECSSRGVKLECVELYFSGNNLSDIDGASFASLFITPKLSKLVMDDCNLSGANMNDIIRECSSRGVKLEFKELYFSGNNLGDIDGASFASLFITTKLNTLDMSNCSLSGAIINDMINECSSRGVKLECKKLYFRGNNLGGIDGASFASLFITTKLNTLVMNICNLSGAIMNDMIRECSSRGVKLECLELYFSGNYLGDIDGASFASLFISTKLNTIDMNNCSLSGAIINDIIKECTSRGVKLECVELYLSGNNLGDIDGASFASLFITPKLNTLDMSNCSLSGAIIDDMINECSSRGVKLECKKLYFRGNNLSDIDGSSFASFFITPKLNVLIMNNCSLSGAIMNKMIRECSSRQTKLDFKEIYFSGNNLSDIDGGSFASLFITPKLNTLFMNNCSLSGVILNEMIRRCSSREVISDLEFVNISENNLSDIDGASFASLFITLKLNKLHMSNCSLSGAIINDMIRECSSRGVKLELKEIYFSSNNLSNIDGASFASFFITPKLNVLIMNNCSLSGAIMDKMIRECSSRQAKLDFKEIYFSDNNFSDIDGASFASLFITPKLNTLNMNNCSLSGAFMNKMIRKCSSRGVKLECKEVYFSGNNLEYIDGASFASLFITTKLIKFVISNCSFSWAIINDMIRECSSRGIKLECKELYFSGNNLKYIDGASFASLFITTKLNTLDMNNCSLSGAIINDMIKECSSRGVKLECQKLYFRGNNLSDIDGSSFASFFITPKLNVLIMNNCSLSGAIMNKIIRECSSRQAKLDFKEIYFSGNNLSDIDGGSFASLFITPKLNKLFMNNCSLSGAIVNDMIRECFSRGVALECKVLFFSENNLSDIDGASFASLYFTTKLNTLVMNKCSLSGAIMNDMIRECSDRGVNFNFKEIYFSDNNLGDIDGASFASLFITPKLNKLYMNNCKLSGAIMNDMIKECSSRGVKLEFKEIYFRDNNLIDIDGFSFASLFITFKLNTLDMSNCSLSGAIINNMFRECSNEKVKLECEELYFSGNNLSDIDGASFASLFITPKLSKLVMSNCSLSGAILNDMIRECFDRGVNLIIKEINFSDNNLGGIDGASFASLFFTPKLSKLDMSNCSLSGAIMNDMIRECSSRGVKLEFNELYFSGNNLEYIDGASFASIFITPKLSKFGMSNCSLSGAIISHMIRVCISRKVKFKVGWFLNQ